jgi:predicted glycosyltransferase
MLIQFFLQTDKGQSKINTLIDRLHTVRLINKHFDLIQWLMGSPDVTRARLLDQDEA